MPELPDVQMFKQYVDATALHQKVKDVKVAESKILDKISKSKFSDYVKGKSFASTRRHGKHLFIKADGRYVHLHFGMTGSLKYFKEQDDQLHHVRVLFTFTNGYRLAYICQRLLGKVGIVDSIDDYIDKNDLGQDALQISLEDFKKAANSTKKAVKPFLMDQKKIAGLGNIYTDEILFQSRIHPEKAANKMNESQLKKIYQNIHKVSNYAVKHKADPEQFGKSYLLPWREKGAACPRCDTSIKQTKISGRTSYVCPKCQKK